MSNAAVNGAHLLRALGYALKAVPKDDGRVRFQHVTFFRHKIVGADGQRWHVGLLPEDAALETPVAVTKASADELVMALDYCRRIANRHKRQFEVTLVEGEVDGLIVKLDYGAKHEIEHVLDAVDVGHIPDEWQEPVPEDAPALNSRHPELHCGAMIDASRWYRSWERDHGSVSMFGIGGTNPVRLDIACSGDLVAQAYLLPVDHPPAELEADEPLLEGTKSGPKRGQSNLDLVIDANAPMEASADEDEEPEEKPKKKRRRKKKETGNGVEAAEAEGSEDEAQP